MKEMVTDMYDFYRVAAVVPDVRVADTVYNVDKIKEKLSELDELDPGIVVFPGLSITGYSCQDLFFQESLIISSNEAVEELISFSNEINRLIAVGAPVRYQGRLFDAAFIIFKGEVLGITVKTMIPEHNEFYEKRWFSSADDLDTDMVFLSEIGIEAGEDYEVPIGNNIIYKIGSGVTVGVEICEDLWAPVPPSTWMALGGAELIINLSASNETIAKRDYRKNLVKQESASSICDYVYVSAGRNESTQDLIFSGHSIIAENGAIINENKDFIANDYIMIADMDLGKVKHDWLVNKTFADTAKLYKDIVGSVRLVSLAADELPESDGSYMPVAKLPFIPSSVNKRLKRCNDIFDMQVNGLAKRLRITGCKAVIGVSGGMDSTLALLVAAMATKKLERPMSDLVTLTMPAFGTTDRTKNNATKLIEALGGEVITIDIKEACELHLKAMGHNLEDKDTTYENTQARERTQLLMDYANMVNGLVVGTGDLSELALGWCTYNGDHMSMYGVNGSIPKTLVRWMIDSVVQNDIFPECNEILLDILDTPISPELLPPDENGNIVQKTEDSIGPYELHDFFLYYMMRYGYTPSKIYYLAKKAFKNDYNDDVIKKWMIMFYRRFFSQQYKRSCMPDGVKVGSVSLSPRGDLRMPSDAAVDIWLDEVEAL